MALIDQPRGNRLAGELGTPDRNVGLRGLFSRRIASGSKLGSIRVLALDTV